MQYQELKTLIEKLEILEQIYESIRIVDPVKKKELSYRNKRLKEDQMQCFDFWGKNNMCDNCISIRAFNEGQTFVKLEYVRDKVYIVTAVPIEIGNRRLVIELMNNTKNSFLYDNRDRESKQEVYSMIDSLNNGQLKDSLTGTYNRRYIDEKLPVEIMKTTLSNGTLSIIMADIHHLKTVMNQYGQLAGEEVIRGFSKRLATCMIVDDAWMARFSGGEFFICLPGVKEKEAVQIAATMKRVTEETPISCENAEISIKADFGVFTMNHTDSYGVEECIEFAREKLYENNYSGKAEMSFF